MDHQKLLADARAIVTEAKRLSAADGVARLVILEGFMLYYDPLLVALLDLQLWLELPYVEAKHRRMTTSTMHNPQYEMCLWPNYVAFKDISVWGGSTNRMFTIDATLPKEALLASALQFLEATWGDSVTTGPDPGLVVLGQAAKL